MSSGSLPVSARLRYSAATFASPRRSQEFWAFHANQAVWLPEFYYRRFERRLGRNAEPIDWAERQPALGPEA